jgi:hypothetical protein
MFQLQITKNKYIIAYKLLADLLFLLMLFFAVMLIVEGLLPGLVSSHISFSRIIFLLVFNIFAIYFVGSFSKINPSSQKSNKKITIFLVILSVILILNSLLKLNIVLALIILLATLLSGYLIYKTIFH